MHSSALLAQCVYFVTITDTRLCGEKATVWAQRVCEGEAVQLTDRSKGSSQSGELRVVAHEIYTAQLPRAVEAGARCEAHTTPPLAALEVLF